MDEQPKLKQQQLGSSMTEDAKAILVDLFAMIQWLGETKTPSNRITAVFERVRAALGLNLLMKGNCHDRN
jgi:hypothetical protein